MDQGQSQKTESAALPRSPGGPLPSPVTLFLGIECLRQCYHHPHNLGTRLRGRSPTFWHRKLGTLTSSYYYPYFIAKKWTVRFRSHEWCMTSGWPARNHPAPGGGWDVSRVDLMFLAFSLLTCPLLPPRNRAVHFCDCTKALFPTD